MRIRRGSESCFSHSQMIRNMLRVSMRRAVTSGAATRGGRAASSPSSLQRKTGKKKKGEGEKTGEEEGLVKNS